MGELSRVRAVSQALVCVCLTRGALAVQVSVALALVGSGGRGALCVREIVSSQPNKLRASGQRPVISRQ